MMNICQLISDKRKYVVGQFIIFLFVFSVIFCFNDRITNKFLQRLSFICQNSIETLIIGDMLFDTTGYSYIYATSGIDIQEDLPACEFLMQTQEGKSVEAILKNNEIIITDVLAKKGNLKIGNKLQVKKLYKAKYEPYIIKDIIHDSYLKTNKTLFDFKGIVYLPYDEDYEKYMKAQYLLISKNGFSELPNDLKIKTCYLLTKNDIIKEFFFYSIFVFSLIAFFYFVLYKIGKNILQEDLFCRIYNLFNLGQERNKNIKLLINLILFIQWLPMQSAIFISFFINKAYLFYKILIMNSSFNIILSFLLFGIVYYRDMRQGRTSLK